MLMFIVTYTYLGFRVVGAQMVKKITPYASLIENLNSAFYIY